MEWLGGLGIAAFLFFLIKGLLWLIVPAALIWWRKRTSKSRVNQSEVPG